MLGNDTEVFAMSDVKEIIDTEEKIDTEELAEKVNDYISNREYA